MIGWEFDGSEPLMTPARKLAYYRQMLGDDGSYLELPDLLVATFQKVAFEHLVESTGGGVVANWPTPNFWPLARGELGGRPVAVARLRVGAPAAASSLDLMFAAGVRSCLVVGSAGGIHPSVPVGSLVIPSWAIRHEGTSHHYLPPGERASASPDLVDALLSAARRHGFPSPAVGPSWTTDAPYRECTATAERLRAAGVLTVEMEAAALFAVARHRSARIAQIIAISDEVRSPWHPGHHTSDFRQALLAAADIALGVASEIPVPTAREASGEGE